MRHWQKGLCHKQTIDVGWCEASSFNHCKSSSMSLTTTHKYNNNKREMWILH